MSRSVAWRHYCPTKIKERLTLASTARLYILHQTGPTGFHIKEEGKDRKLKVFLGDPHTCSCNTFMNERELCIHILWLLVKKFKFKPEDPLIYQKGLIEREINDLVLRELGERNRSVNHRAINESTSPLSYQRELQEGDVCPICQEVLSQANEPLTFCRQSCGKSLHVRCMKMWADHQKSLGEVKIKCPLCREDFGAYEELNKESLEAKKQTYKNSRAPNVHTGCVCCRCLASPIIGVCYRCRECAEYFLCSKCYLIENHNPAHTLQIRRYLSQKWKKADPPKALPPLPPGLANVLESREISSEDYDTLLQLDSQPDPSKGVAEYVLSKFYSHPIKPNSSLLLQREHCEICKRAYAMGEWIRKLPNCSHQFHRDCIDYKLRYFQTTCPIDGNDVYPKRKIEIRMKSHSANIPTKIGSAKSLKQGCIITGPLLSSLPNINGGENGMDMLVAGAQIMHTSQQKSETITNAQTLLPISLNNGIGHMESNPVIAPQSLLYCKPLFSQHQASPLNLPSLTRTKLRPIRIRPEPTAGTGGRSRKLADRGSSANRFQDIFVGSHVEEPVILNHPATAKPTPRLRHNSLMSRQRNKPQFAQLEVLHATVSPISDKHTYCCYILLSKL
ncbi:E3 ubiquitin-protein ligase ZSWIM2-like isoform X2 [Oopsacas minuta]|uniref:E3 ubiquitin-protein ligase ZSWIM2-like isoform X2 n=1 Tax=Oopsacas minuta TaxID=111878 RepID=A0AAV7JKJ8_9METZ|nr:E3 ubiquitin-protein ligase ZSWIM2-like isoform X2 [Oopsacas minuta]